ncbi:hypothetical protein ACO2I3_17885 [Leptospira interrogans]
MANVDQLRHDIDTGRTSDKVAAFDPAAAPLGTDDEAAGVSIDPRVVAALRESELRLGDLTRQSLRSGDRPRSDPIAWLLTGAFASAFAGILGIASTFFPV